MSAMLVNIPTDIREVASELETDDEILNIYELEELGAVPPFDGMSPAPANFPGSMILRRVTKGRVMCRQGEFGATAFQILTTAGAIDIRKAQVRAVDLQIEKTEAAVAAAAEKLQNLSELQAKIESQLNDESDEFRAQALSKKLEGCRRGSADARRNLEELTQRAEELRQKREGRLAWLEDEIRRLEAQQLESADESASTPVAEARLIVSPDKGGGRKGLLHRFVDRLRGRHRRTGSAPAMPRYIPNDGPEDLDAQTLCAPMYRGDLFGEMSCMHLAPRSATVFVTDGTDDSPCYMIEMIRTAFDSLRGSKEYRAQIDSVYRERVMETQVRSLPLFQVLTDDEYQWLSENVELAEFAPGEVIFDEHQHSDDCCYVIRSGVVKVSTHLGILLGPNEVKSIPALCQELVENAESSPGSEVWKDLPPQAQEMIQTLADSKDNPDPERREQVRRALNEWIRTSTICQQLGRTVDDVALTAGLSEYSTLLNLFGEKTKDWPPLEVRVFNRILLETVCPGQMPRRSIVASNERTLAYHSRGQIIGEVALLRGQDRNATCLAFTHPLSGQKTAGQAHLIPQRVEAVRIRREVLDELMARSKAFAQLVEQRLQEISEPQTDDGKPGQVPASQTMEFEDLGLAWGQQLMRVDLNKCTRCQECVKACVDAHDDGRSRLYLDGPRFGKYLIPVTCRQCIDPVCMIGCPVGAINPGSNGEIQISDWCIGCSKCADQCPYGSIQMDVLPESPAVDHDLSNLFGPGYRLRSVMEKAVVCDLCSSTPSGEPSCVYACPHDAAERVVGLQGFSDTIQ